VTRGEVHSAEYGTNKGLIKKLNITIDQAKQGCPKNVPAGSWCAGMQHIINVPKNDLHIQDTNHAVNQQE